MKNIETDDTQPIEQYAECKCGCSSAFILEKHEGLDIEIIVTEKEIV